MKAGFIAEPKFGGAIGQSESIMPRTRPGDNQEVGYVEELEYFRRFTDCNFDC